MNTDARNFKVKLFDQTITIYFNYDWLPEIAERKITWCVIETERHEIYSGIAVRHPHEPNNTKMGWKISLKRACNALDCFFGDTYYKHFWHEIRLQLRNEQFAEAQEEARKALKETTKPTNKIVVEPYMEEENERS